VLSQMPSLDLKGRKKEREGGDGSLGGEGARKNGRQGRKGMEDEKSCHLSGSAVSVYIGLQHACFKLIISSSTNIKYM